MTDHLGPTALVERNYSTLYLREMVYGKDLSAVDI